MKIIIEVTDLPALFAYAARLSGAPSLPPEEAVKWLFSEDVLFGGVGSDTFFLLDEDGDETPPIGTITVIP